LDRLGTSGVVIYEAPFKLSRNLRFHDVQRNTGKASKTKYKNIVFLFRSDKFMWYFNEL
jgi:hypothetical protein